MSILREYFRFRIGDLRLKSKVENQEGWRPVILSEALHCRVFRVKRRIS